MLAADVRRNRRRSSYDGIKWENFFAFHSSTIHQSDLQFFNYYFHFNWTRNMTDEELAKAEVKLEA